MSFYGFSAPFLRAYIIGTDGTGQRVPFGPFTAEESDRAQRLFGWTGGHLSFLTDVSIEQKMNGVFDLSLTLSPTYEESRMLLSSKCKLIVQGRTQVAVSLGYLDAEQSPMETETYLGTVMSIDLSMGTSPSIVLKAKPVAANLVVSAVNRQINGTRIDILKTILKNSNVSKTVSFDFTHASNNKDLHFNLYYDQAGKSDFAAIRELILDSGCTFNVTPDGRIEVYDAQYRWNRQPDFIFALYQVPETKDKNTQVIPVANVSTSSTHLFLPNSDAIAQRMVNVDDKTRKTTPVVKTPDTERIPAKPPAASPQGKASTSTHGKPPTALDRGQSNSKSGIGQLRYGQPKDANQAGRDKTSLVAGIEGIKLSVDPIYGVPNLTPGKSVRIVGVGERIDGDYGVLTVTHTFSASSGFATKFECMINAQLADEELSVRKMRDNPIRSDGSSLGEGKNTIEATPKGTRPVDLKAARAFDVNAMKDANAFKDGSGRANYGVGNALEDAELL